MREERKDGVRVTTTEDLSSLRRLWVRWSTRLTTRVVPRGLYALLVRPDEVLRLRWPSFEPDGAELVAALHSATTGRGRHHLDELTRRELAQRLLASAEELGGRSVDPTPVLLLRAADGLWSKDDERRFTDAG